MSIRFDDNGMMLPGAGMKVERIPLPDDIVRLEILKVVAMTGGSPITSNLIDKAVQLEGYVREGRRQDEYHDDNTLFKARQAIMSTSSHLSGEEADEIINEMLNKGLLLRERR